jgi:hypothetical protein
MGYPWWIPVGTSGSPEAAALVSWVNHWHDGAQGEMEDKEEATASWRHGQFSWMSKLWSVPESVVPDLRGFLPLPLQPRIC